ncbi:ABC transporter permease [Ruania zhangjianzhongii]|uniref:ABC transporter permease n=1 Tax=Ruania zhangjianzhongii TaxID=2603206 RepID=UPI0011C7CA3B|nr:ABC transporter permease [Ruania zhangjianzhongii]
MTSPTLTATRRAPLAATVQRYANEWMIVVLFVALVLICSIAIDGFRDLGNLLNIARQVSFLAIAGLGQFFVILVAKLDLSVGSSIGLTSVLLAGLVANHSWPMWASVLAVLALSIVIGLVNGVVVVLGKVPAFICTLVMMNVLMGVAYLYSRGLPIGGLPSWFNYFGMGYLFMIPVPVYAMVIIAVLCSIFTNRTALGRSFYAVGGNEEASRLSGINVRWVIMLAFVIASVLTTLASIGVTSRTMSGGASLGEGMLFDIITVVILGGTSLFGGRGNVFGVIVAALLLGVITNAMVLLGIDTYFQWIIKGAILIVVVYIDANSRKS